MLAALHHRGPDDQHIVSGDRFALGAARLSIIDVAGGRQPLTNEDGTVVAAQNGELYNFPVARPALLARGHRLQTHTDTELLPHLWEDHGERLPEHIDGMFAVARLGQPPAGRDCWRATGWGRSRCTTGSTTAPCISRRS